MKIPLYFLPFACLLSACDDPAENNLIVNKQDLIGKWTFSTTNPDCNLFEEDLEFTDSVLTITQTCDGRPFQNQPTQVSEYTFDGKHTISYHGFQPLTMEILALDSAKLVIYRGPDQSGRTYVKI